MIGIAIILSFVIIGVFIGMNVVIPYAMYEYIAVAILAFLDSIFGAIVANMKNKYDNLIFLTGFFCNAIIAIVLVYLGDKLAVDIYLAAVIVFSSRIIINFSVIRRIYFNNLRKKVKKEKIKEDFKENLNKDI